MHILTLWLSSSGMSWVTNPAYTGTACWPQEKPAPLWRLSGCWLCLVLRPQCWTCRAAPDSFTHPDHAKVMWSFTRLGPLWLRNSLKGKTPKIWSGTLQRASPSNLCTLKLTRRRLAMSCLGYSPTPEGPTLPCTHTDPGPLDSTLASARWRRATSFTGTISKVNFPSPANLCALPCGQICSTS